MKPAERMEPPGGRNHSAAGRTPSVADPRATEGRRRPRLSLSGVAAISLVVAGAGLLAWGAYIPVKAVVAQVLLERAFDRALAQAENGAGNGASIGAGNGAGRPSAAAGVRVKPWSWADTWPVARLEVPRLRERTIVLSGDSGQALAFGPGLVAGTVPPGEAGVSVIAAHRDTHFSFLKKVKTGDRITVTRTDGSRHAFVAERSEVVRWDATGIDAGTRGRWLVLATCWPFEARVPGPDRYILVARSVEAR